MIKDYVKIGEKVLVHDSEEGIYEVPYQDNIDLILNTKEDIRVLKEKLEESQNYENNLEENEKNVYLIRNSVFASEVVFNFIYLVLGMPFALSALIFLDCILWALLVVCGLHAYQNEKNLKKEMDDIQMVISYLKDEINNKKELLEKLEIENLKSKGKLVTLNNGAKKKLLEKQLDLLVLYKNSRAEGKNAEDILSLVEDQESEKFVRALISKER